MSLGSKVEVICNDMWERRFEAGKPGFVPIKCVCEVNLAQPNWDNGVKNEAMGELGGIEIMCGCLRLVFAKGQSY